MKLFDMKKSRTFLTVLVMTLGLAACDNNDENSPVIPPAQITTDVVFGDYAGQMFTSLVEKEEGTAGTEVSAAVNNDTIAFDSIPVKDIILSVVNDEETANQIVEAIGAVAYKIGYTPSLTEAKDSVLLALDPKPLELTFSLPSEGEEAQQFAVKVQISAMESGNAYEVESAGLKFHFVAEEVLLNEQPVAEFKPMLFDFEMKQQ